MTDRCAARLRSFGVLGLACVLLSLAGCLQTLQQPVCPPTAQAAQGSIRMMVSFRQSVNGQAPAILQQLQAHAGACASYLSSVSPTLHVYGFSGVTVPSVLSQKLRAWSLVQNAVPDARARAH